MNHIPSYFYVPSWDFPPAPTGPVKIGSIITSLKRPEQSLGVLAPNDVFKSTKKRVDFSKEKLRQGKFSIMTKFLSILGVGVDLGVVWDKKHDETYTFDCLETEQYVPTIAYIQQAIDFSPDIASYLAASRYCKPVYLITGVKTAYGCHAKTTHALSIGGNLSGEVDATVWTGVPMSCGPGMESKTGNSMSMGWDESSDFVFAFQVWRVKVARKTGMASGKDFKKGANLEYKAEEAEKVELEVKDVGEVTGKEAKEFEEVRVEEDGEAVSCAVLKAEDEEDDD